MRGIILKTDISLNVLVFLGCTGFIDVEIKSTDVLSRSWSLNSIFFTVIFFYAQKVLCYNPPPLFLSKMLFTRRWCCNYNDTKKVQNLRNLDVNWLYKCKCMCTVHRWIKAQYLNPRYTVVVHLTPALS